jgi:hypothetical protein
MSISHRSKCFLNSIERLHSTMNTLNVQFFTVTDVIHLQRTFPTETSDGGLSQHFKGLEAFATGLTRIKNASAECLPIFNQISVH